MEQLLGFLLSCEMACAGGSVGKAVAMQATTAAGGGCVVEAQEAWGWGRSGVGVLGGRLEKIMAADAEDGKPFGQTTSCGVAIDIGGQRDRMD